MLGKRTVESQNNSAIIKCTDHHQPCEQSAVKCNKCVS